MSPVKPCTSTAERTCISGPECSFILLSCEGMTSGVWTFLWWLDKWPIIPHAARLGRVARSSNNPHEGKD